MILFIIIILTKQMHLLRRNWVLTSAKRSNWFLLLMLIGVKRKNNFYIWCLYVKRKFVLEKPRLHNRSMKHCVWIKSLCDISTIIVYQGCIFYYCCLPKGCVFCQWGWCFSSSPLYVTVLAKLIWSWFCKVH